MERKPNRAKKPKRGFQIGSDDKEESMEEQLRDYREKRDEEIMKEKVKSGEVDPEELQRTIEEEEE